METFAESLHIQEVNVTPKAITKELQRITKKDKILLYRVQGTQRIFEKNIFWVKTIHYPNTLKSRLVTIVPMAPFAPKSTSKLRSALHFSYSIVIRRFYSRAILITIITTVFLTLLATTTMFI